MILVIGPTGSGKTLLLKRLEERSKASTGKQKKSHTSLDEDTKSVLSDDERERIPATVPTIGTNVCSVTLGRHKAIILKEIGGSMAPLWKSSYKHADKVLYLIDLSNPFQISATSVLLDQVLSSNDLLETPVLLVLNKIDNFCSISHSEMKYLLDLDGIIAETTQKVDVVEASTKYSSGLDDVIKWICE